MNTGETKQQISCVEGKEKASAVWNFVMEQQWMTNYFVHFLCKEADSQFREEQHFLLCLSRIPLLTAFSQTVLGNYICLLCYVLGIKLWKLFWIVKHLFPSFSFSVCPCESMVCVRVCVFVCKGKRRGTLNANRAVQEELMGRKAGGRLTDLVSI